MWRKVKLALGMLGGAVVALWLYATAHKQGRNKGRKEVLREHQQVIAKIEEKEAKKHAINQDNVQAKLNDYFGGKPK